MDSNNAADSEVKPTADGAASSAGVTWLGESPSAWSLAVSARAVNVLRLGVWWGFVEWLAWGWASETQVTLHAGDSEWRVFDMFVPPEVSARARKWPHHLHVLCVRYSACGSGIADGLDSVNHYVYCMPSAEQVGISSLGSADLWGSAQTYNSLRSAEVELVNYYGRLGYVVIFTVAQGDCGPDTIAVHQGVPSTPTSWKRIRRVTHDALLRLRGEPWFYDSWHTCQEHACGAAPAAAPAPPCIGVTDEPAPPPCSEVKPAASTAPPPPRSEVKPAAPTAQPPLPPPDFPAPPSPSAENPKDDVTGDTAARTATTEGDRPAVPLPSLPAGGGDQPGSASARDSLVPLAEMAHVRRNVVKTIVKKKTRPKPQGKNISARLSHRVRVGEELKSFAEGRAVIMHMVVLFVVSPDFPPYNI